MKTRMFVAISLLLVRSVAAGDALSGDRYTQVDTIRISEMRFEQSSLDSILFYMLGKIESLDPTPGQPPRIPIVEVGFADEHKLPLADYSATKVTVKNALADLSDIFGVQFHATSVGIVVSPPGAKCFPNYKAKSGTVFYTYPTTNNKANKSEQATPKKPSD